MQAPSLCCLLKLTAYILGDRSVCLVMAWRKISAPPSSSSVYKRLQAFFFTSNSLSIVNMMPAWRYRPVSATQRRRRAQSAKTARPFSPVRPWDAGGVEYERLDATSYLEKTLAALSPNDVLARSTLLRRLGSRGITPRHLEISIDAGSTVVHVVKEPVCNSTCQEGERIS